MAQAAHEAQIDGDENKVDDSSTLPTSHKAEPERASIICSNPPKDPLLPPSDVSPTIVNGTPKPNPEIILEEIAFQSGQS